MTLNEAREALLRAHEAMSAAFAEPVLYGGRRPGEMSPRQAARYRLAQAVQQYEDALLAGGKGQQMKVKLATSAPGSDGQLEMEVTAEQYLFLRQVALAWNTANPEHADPFMTLETL